MIPVKAVLSENKLAKMELDGFFESPEDNPPKWLCMLRLYLDESIDDATGMCFVAGYMGKKKHWKNYVKAWRKELEPRTSIHISQLRLGSSQAPKRYSDLLNRLGGVPEKCGLRPIVGSICRKDYASKVSGTVLEILMEGYILAILGLMDELGKHLHNEPVIVFFEEHVIHATLRESAMILWRKRHKRSSGFSSLVGWGSVPKGTLTEAADYLCYASQQFYLDPNSQKTALTAAILNQDVIHSHTGKASIDEWIRQISISRVGHPIPLLTTANKKIIRGR